MGQVVGENESVKQPKETGPDAGTAGDAGFEAAQRLELRIREAAYLMWEAAGGYHGRSLDYWLAAEREIMAELRSALEQASKEADGPASSSAEKSTDPQSDH